MGLAEFKVIIPVRYASQRLPGKVLLDIAGRSMLSRVHERCLQSGATDVYVATCDDIVAEEAHRCGAQVVMTEDTHTCGTERIIEAVQKLQLGKEEIVVNVQGDEPQMPPAAIAQVAGLVPADGMATLMDTASEKERADPNAVKVVCDVNGCALYFSRATIPHARSPDHSAPGAASWNRHLGIYAYRVSLLQRWGSWSPCALEQAEQLEQLRPLYYGAPIAVAPACVSVPAGVDTAEDLERTRTQCQLS